MLRQRVITAAIVLVIVLAAVFAGRLSWQVLIFLGCIACAYEFSAMLGQKWYHVTSVWAYGIITIVLWWPNWVQSVVLQAMVAVTFAIPVLLRNRVTIMQSATIFAGALYIGFGGASLAQLRYMDKGLAWLFLFMISIWVTDTAAYFGGSYFKGPKLWPDISPKKTISGAVTGVIAGGLAAALVGSLFIHPLHSWWYFLIGCLISLVGQLGDLVESAYKRSAGVKDSGKLLPGHGGVLDRVDSMLFAAPLALFLISSQPWV